MRLLALLICALALGACDDTFEAPPRPDLYKDPYDFAIKPPPTDDLGVVDLLGADLTKTTKPDLAEGDLSMPDLLSSDLAVEDSN